jgi:hypothetical protein
MQMMMDVVVKRNEIWKEHAILTYIATSTNHENLILMFIYDSFTDAY